ncbi:hypothetical protein C8J55DRAFT_567279 [Lentinula edodes]|uniref:Uncharacterized protein n=1 Tax=Lentinula lateritia TaxID=40482 RepID=A0A9W9DCY0_9AGAR|nr:hypothetical protein C8J55DRAFT_567279 [Lentinula edodes]
MGIACFADWKKDKAGHGRNVMAEAPSAVEVENGKGNRPSKERRCPNESDSAERRSSSPTPMTGATNPALRPMNSHPPRVASPRSAIRQLRRRPTWSATAPSLFWSPTSVSPPVPPTPLPVSTASTMRTSNLRRERERERNGQ